MAIKKFKPTSNANRNRSVSKFTDITTNKREKTLSSSLNKRAGRNNLGRITTRHQGGGHKRQYRVIDFKRTKDGIPGRGASIEYDQNRTTNVVNIHNVDGDKR